MLARDEGYVVYATARTESKLVELARSIESNPHNKGVALSLLLLIIHRMSLQRSLSIEHSAKQVE